MEVTEHQCHIRLLILDAKSVVEVDGIVTKTRLAVDVYVKSVEVQAGKSERTSHAKRWKLSVIDNLLMQILLADTIS